VGIRIILLSLLLVLGGCSGQGFPLENLAKTDIDVVADLHYLEVERILKQLTVKIYKRNPRFLYLGSDFKGERTVDNRVKQIFGEPGNLQFDELSVTGSKAIELALDEQYRGDRVFALMVGLTDMLRQSYGYESEFFMFDELDEQKLYLSARNLEIAIWRINTYLDARKVPLVLTNSRNGEQHNLSYAQLFGKLISLQDMLAVIVAGHNQRVIRVVVLKAASMAFFPL
jgi:hypothetical protein